MKAESRDVYMDVPDRRVIRTRDVYQERDEIGTAGYSETVLAVVANYNNSGVPENFNAVGMAGRSKHGAKACQLFAEMDDETQTIKHIGFKCRGCLAITACSSVICDMAYQKTYDEALAITPKQLLDALDGLPADKQDMAYIACEALHALIGDRLIQVGGVEEQQRLAPCDDSSIGCIFAEECSLRNKRVDMLYGHPKEQEAAAAE